MRFIVYTRCSTDEQSQSGLGLESQADQCRAFAERNNGEFVGPFADEAISGAAGLDDRPQLLVAIAAVKRGDVLLVAKRDRLARDPIISAMAESLVKRKGARIASAAGEGTENDDPTSILMRRLVDSFSEYERLLIGARTKSALQAKIKRGERAGKIRFGYDLAPDGVSLVPNPAEQAVLRLICEEHARGHSPRKIARILTQRGVPTKAGRAIWQHTTVRQILARAN